jgi:hypothetical protein
MHHSKTPSGGSPPPTLWPTSTVAQLHVIEPCHGTSKAHHLMQDTTSDNQERPAKLAAEMT